MPETSPVIMREFTAFTLSTLPTLLLLVINTKCPGWRIARRRAFCQDAVDLGLGHLAAQPFGWLPRPCLIIVCHRLHHRTRRRFRQVVRSIALQSRLIA